MTTSDQLTARQALATDTASQLFAFEQALDTAVARGAALTATLAQGRTPAGLAMIVGAAALADISQSTATLAQTRQVVAKAHAELAAVARKFNMEVEMAGGGEKFIAPLPASADIRRVA